MKNLKFTLLAIVLLTATSASAQFSFGVRGGVNMSNIQTDVQDVITSPKFGFTIGAFADFDFSPDMAIQSGLFFSTKGSRENVTVAVSHPDGYFTRTDRIVTNFLYLQLPVHFAYRIDVSPGTRVVFHGGPYVAYAVGGSVRVNGERDRNAFGCRVVQYQPFDWGLGIGVGGEFERILVGIGWDFGLFDISNQSNVRSRNQNAFLTVGYRF